MPQYAVLYANAKLQIGDEEATEPIIVEADDVNHAVELYIAQIRTSGVVKGFEIDPQEVGGEGAAALFTQTRGGKKS